jgi:16S rRNA processing protein RimM
LNKGFIPVGQIVASHGLKGEVKFRYYNETGSAFLQYPSFFVDQNNKKIELRLLRARPQGSLFVIQFKGFDTIEKVQPLLRKELLVAEKDLPPPEEDEYYDYQLVGLDVVSEDGSPIGRVTEVVHTRGSDILVVAGETETLVPMTGDHIAGIDVKGGLIRVRPEALA